MCSSAGQAAAQDFPKFVRELLSQLRATMKRPPAYFEREQQRVRGESLSVSRVLVASDFVQIASIAGNATTRALPASE